MESSLKVGIMQPYFLPYIGYYQLIAGVDVFVIYDNIKYTKKGWINRNRFLQNGKEEIFSIPLKKDSDSLNIDKRELANEFNRIKLMNQFRGAYGSAPFFIQINKLVERIIFYEESNLFGFLHNSLIEVCQYLRIDTKILVSSDIEIDSSLKSQAKVLAICTSLGADTYINPIGGVDLYSKSNFKSHGIDLRFIRCKPFEYKQFGDDFLPWLSIVDVLMFNSVETIRSCIYNNYELG